MKKILLGFIAGFLSCVILVYGLGAYNAYKIHQMDEMVAKRQLEQP